MNAKYSAGWSKCLRIALAFWLIATSVSLPEIIKIGGIFETSDDDQELYFRYAIDRINTDNSILPRSRLQPVVVHIASNDSFRAYKIVCEMLVDGVAAIFGPRSPSLSNIVQSACNAFEIPNIYMWWDVGFRFNHHSISVYPDLPSLVEAALEIVDFKRWEKFTLIYQEPEDLIRYQDLLTKPSIYNKKITLRQLPENPPYKVLMKEARRNGENNVVLDTPVDTIVQVFRDAREVGMLTDYHNYLVTSLDFHTVDFKEFHASRSNITALRLVDPSRLQVVSVIKDWIFGELRYGRPTKSRHVLKTGIALLYDAVTLFSQALQDLDRSQPIQIYPVECTRPEVTTYGRSVVSYMKMLRMVAAQGVATSMQAFLCHVQLFPLVFSMLAKEVDEYLNKQES